MNPTVRVLVVLTRLASNFTHACVLEHDVVSRLEGTRLTMKDVAGLDSRVTMEKQPMSLISSPAATRVHRAQGSKSRFEDQTPLILPCLLLPLIPRESTQPPTVNQMPNSPGSGVPHILRWRRI